MRAAFIISAASVLLRHAKLKQHVRLRKLLVIDNNRSDRTIPRQGFDDARLIRCLLRWMLLTMPISWLGTLICTGCISAKREVLIYDYVDVR
jgi:hypothetical protein